MVKRAAELAPARPAGHGKTPSHHPFSFVPSWPSESSSAPVLFPLVSCENVLLDEKLVAMGCLARDFLPSSVSFSWTYKNSSAISTSAITSFPSVLREGKYLATSQLFLPSADILKGLDEFVTCSVKHSAGDKNVKVPLTGETEPPPLSPAGRGGAGPG